MRSLYFYLITIIVLSIAISAGANEQTISITKNITSMPLAFTENKGQWDEQVLYRADAGGATMWFTKEGAVYQFTRTVSGHPREGGEPGSIDASSLDSRLRGNDIGSGDNISSGRQTPSSAPDMMHQPDSIESIAIKANFVGANSNPQMSGVDMMEYKCNYFIGNDPNNWHTDVANYTSVMYEEIYSGIDLKYYGNGKQMEYDFIVSPGADYSQIKIQYEGVKSLSVNAAGELVVETDWGEVVEQRPVIYQVENKNRVPVEGVYRLQGDNSFGFELNNYNPALPLVIDPVLSYSTYLGGGSDDIGYGIAVDAFGSAYVTGCTNSTDFPTLNPYQTDQADWDVFVSKLSNSGNSLIYSTFLGGNSEDHGIGIAVDDSGSTYVTGYTSSTDFPVLNPYQTDQGDQDVFVTKLSSSGSSLVYSTYLGGGSTDIGQGISVDASGNAYVTGYTHSTDFPTLNPYQTDQGNTDVFVTKLSSSGNSLIYSTYLGGGSYDIGYGIAVDAFGSAYVIGSIFSTDFPILNPYQSNHAGGQRDVFVTKLSSSGNSLIYSTYLGGGSYDFGYGIAVDAFGSAYVTGYTSSTDFPVLNPYQTDQGDQDVFVTKLSSSGSSLVYSTYLGGSGYEEDYFNDIAVDAFGSAYVTGCTFSTDFPTLNPYQTDQVDCDVFVTKLSSSGNSLVYSTYLGGGSYDYGYGIAVDAIGSAYVTGCTHSTDFPTLNPYQGTCQYSRDAFVTKISEANDIDGDWIADEEDNCPYDYNTSQTDIDGDLAGDVCDICEGFDDNLDTDTDGVPDGCDNCPDSVNSDQLDTDSDTFGDACDNCPDSVNADQSDTDDDTFGDACDNCPDSVNTDQLDTDGDTFGDVCDNCLEVYNPDQTDINGDGIGDICCCQLRGDVAVPKDGIVLVNDIVLLVNYIFKSGTAPTCLDEGDCAIPLDSQILVNDIVYLVNYLFKSGTIPPDC